MNKLIYITIALAGLGLTGCTSTRYWGKSLPPPTTIADLKTKAQVMEAFGGPANIAYNDTGQAMAYVHNEGSGGGFAVGTFMPLLSWQREHTCADTLIFLLDLDGNVKKHLLLVGTERLNDSIWPFNEAVKE